MAPLDGLLVSLRAPFRPGWVHRLPARIQRFPPDGSADIFPSRWSSRCHRWSIDATCDNILLSWAWVRSIAASKQTNNGVWGHFKCSDISIKVIKWSKLTLVKKYKQQHNGHCGMESYEIENEHCIRVHRAVNRMPNGKEKMATRPTSVRTRGLCQERNQWGCLLDDVQQCGQNAFEVDDQRDELSLVEFRRRRSSAIEQIESHANEQKFVWNKTNEWWWSSGGQHMSVPPGVVKLTYFDEIVPPFYLANGILNVALERGVGEEGEALACVVNVDQCPDGQVAENADDDEWEYS